ncbi:MAG TPA: RNA polymerase subunit sigma-70 [Prevotella sp.]|nr:RNA polymerase subunit sigma-70 [Prevotella sp.]
MKTDERIILGKLQNPSTIREGFCMMVRQYSEPLYWKIRRIVLNHEDADDVLQNVFMKVWSHLDDFKGGSSLSTWLFRIAINEALDFLRKNKNNVGISDNGNLLVVDRLMADEYFDGDETQAKLQAAIATLPEKQRVVFNMKYFDDMKYSEISKVLGTSEGALKASYHLAVGKITEYLKIHN